MANLDRRAAWLLFGVLIAASVLGFSQGLVHALAAPRPEQAAAGVDPSRDPIPNASAMTGAGLDEGRIRQIAREEAVAALATPRAKKAAPVVEKADAGGDAPAPATPPQAPAAPSPAAPPAPAPAPPPAAAVPPY